MKKNEAVVVLYYNVHRTVFIWTDKIEKDNPEYANYALVSFLWEELKKQCMWDILLEYVQHYDYDNAVWQLPSS